MINNNDRFAVIDELLKIAPIIPSVEVLDEFDAVPLVDALQSGGTKTIQVNLRTDAAYDSIGIIKNRCPQIVVGAGNVRTPDMLKKAIDAGAEFASSPGNTDMLLAAVDHLEVPFLPGVNTGSDMMRALEHGHYKQKFCPIVSLDAIKALKYYQKEFFDVKFCISGALNDDNIKEYLLLSNVQCVMGSWIVRAHDIYNKRWAKVTERTVYSYENIAKYLKEAKTNNKESGIADDIAC